MNEWFYSLLGPQVPYRKDFATFLTITILIIDTRCNQERQRRIDIYEYYISFPYTGQMLIVQLYFLSSMTFKISWNQLQLYN
ncbi:hypothetical protein PIROE2DRAFT_2166 [Piromyces sp. E2]|nr:hypothetical protein PIROE2DRAFT_2166 [Piromyces sp. E2]|eukprot:OUM69748.1 hypothetical protein PIROE2DRAFT_2166 [Piromyces sp. E2]